MNSTLIFFKILLELQLDILEVVYRIEKTSFFSMSYKPFSCTISNFPPPFSPSGNYESQQVIIMFEKVSFSIEVLDARKARMLFSKLSGIKVPSLEQLLYINIISYGILVGAVLVRKFFFIYVIKKWKTRKIGAVPFLHRLFEL